MNKKLIVLILTVFMLLTTVVISIFGKQPDPPVVHVEKIEFTPGEGDIYEYNEDGTLVVKVDIQNVQKTGDKYIIEYQLNYIIGPEDAANKILHFNVGNPDYKNIVSFTSTGLMTVELEEKRELNITVKVSSADDASRAEAQMIIILEYEIVDNPW